MNLCIIPARGGSKRIPRKNINEFYGKPMLAHAIKHAQQSGCFDDKHIIVSTDDAQIASVARDYGAEVLLRPDVLADDYATTTQVIHHTILQYKACHPAHDLAYICCLYPCTPLLAPDWLAQGLAMLKQSNVLYSFPVLPFHSSIYRGLSLDTDHHVSALFSEHEKQRTQDLAEAYYDAGQFYWGSQQAWLTEPSIHNHAVGMILAKNSVVDIDDIADWRFAEQLYAMRQATP